MWILEARPSGSTDERSLAAQQVRHYLPAGLHVVGRTQAIGQSCIVVDEDKSISRQHATVTVNYTSPLFRVKGNPSRKIKCVSQKPSCNRSAYHMVLQTWDATELLSINRSSKEEKRI